MGIADPLVAAHERGEGDAFRRGEGRIPGRAMGDGRHRLAAFVRVRAGGLVLDKRRARERVLALGEPLELLLAHLAH